MAALSSPTVFGKEDDARPVVATSRRASSRESLQFHVRDWCPFSQLVFKVVPGPWDFADAALAFANCLRTQGAARERALGRPISLTPVDAPWGPERIAMTSMKRAIAFKRRVASGCESLLFSRSPTEGWWLTYR